jgi:HK97 family phage prohead protease
MQGFSDAGLETKFCRFAMEASVGADGLIEGYASLFGAPDQSGDVVERGAYARSLGDGRRIKMLWQHDPREPIGTWDEVREDRKGLYVRGHLLSSVARAREAAALIEAGAIDGLSIGYRTVRATKNDKGQRLLSELELWEVSLVTFPMLPQARLSPARPDAAKSELLRDLATAFDEARRKMAVRSAR